MTDCQEKQFSSTDVLDFLFNDNGGLLDTAASTKDLVNMPAMPEIETDVLFNLLNDGTLSIDLDLGELASENEILPTQELEEDSLFCQTRLTNSIPISSETVITTSIDHKYSKSPPRTRNDSVASTDCPLSPHSSCRSIEDDLTMSGSESSLLNTDFDSGIGSPLGSGVEDLQLSDFNFDNLDDPTSWFPEFPDDELLKSETETNFDVDMEDTKSDLLKALTDAAGITGSKTLPFTMKDILGNNDQKFDTDYDTIDVDLETVGPNNTLPGRGLSQLRLSDEEKELLSREGVVLPSNMPLTKKKKVPTATLR